MALDPGVGAGILASVGTGLATGIGALPVLGLRRLSDKQQMALLAFAGGVMLAASIFSLILPALAAAVALGHARSEAWAMVVIAVGVGAGLLSLANRYLPVPESTGPDGRTGAELRSVWLLVVAVTVHNIPEGAAVGMSFVDGSTISGTSTAVGIGVQNMPEGLAVACALLAAGYSRGKAFLGGVASGLVEPMAGAASAVLVSLARPLLPWGLALAAGAMLQIVFVQVLPDILRFRPSVRLPYAAFSVGTVLMLCLDVGLGA